MSLKLNRNSLGLLLLLYFLVFVFMVLSLHVGRVDISFPQITDCIKSTISSEAVYCPPLIEKVLIEIRVPRIILAVLVGGALAVSGASYQTLFKNPLVSPSILGVSSGAAFGAALAMVLDGTWWEIQLFALIFGLAAVFLANLISFIFGRRELTVLILGGVVVSSLFGSLLSILKLAADEENVLPSIVFWLMGSLGRASFRDVLIIIPSLVFSLLLLYLYRYQINAMAAGEDEAATMGVRTSLVKINVIIAATLMTGIAVSMCGIVGWIGMVVPHMARLTVGASFPKLIGFSFALGGLFLLLIDTLIRGVPGLDLPLGVLTSLFGTPIFVFFLSRVNKGWR